MKQRVGKLNPFPFELNIEVGSPAPHGGARKGAGRKPAKIDMKVVRKMREDGMTYANIGKAFGVTGWTVQTRLSKEK